MKQLFISKRGISIEEAPDPILTSNTVLVSNKFSCISIGTELSSLKSIQKPILTKIFEKPNILRKVIKSYSKGGIDATSKIIKRKLNQVHELGYSSAGVVLEVGEEIDFLKKGDYVACSGGGIASHAEKILVPKNLIVKINDKDNLCEYSTVSLGAIALNGVRRAEPTIGESFLVVGLGLIGQITIQILRNCGIEVLAIDPNPNFLKKARDNNFEHIFENFKQLDKFLFSENKKIELDGAIITASSKSNEILKNTFRACRKKSRVILVGDVGLKINREDIYKKEIDFKISSSYGPGRYDHNYEIKGNDYPLPYVRWTLNRNMKTYSNMIEKKLINVKSLIDKVSDLKDAPTVYSSLEASKRPLSAFIKYNSSSKQKRNTITFKKNTIQNGKINAAIIGAGSFASEIVIPNLLKMKNKINIDTICTKTPVSAINKAKQYNIKNISTNYTDILANKNINTVFITTRHNMHCEMICKAIEHKKNIFVEKPLCVNRHELIRIKQLEVKNSKILVCGFNRRFSEYAKITKKFIINESGPVLINYFINADKLEKNSWVYSLEGGGRNIGEACHFYDLILYLLDSKVVDIKVSNLTFEQNRFHKTDNFFVTLKFSDNSIANIHYSTVGGIENKKEIIHVRANNKTLEIDDFKNLSIRDEFKKKEILNTKMSQKGHNIILKNFLDKIEKPKDSDAFESQFLTMDLTFKIEELI